MANTVEYYLSKGFDLPMARYYAGGRRKITSVTPNDDFTLTLSFDNGEKRRLDVKPLLTKGTVFEPFCDISNFRRVYLDEQHCVSWDIDPEVDSNVVWNNKVDLCPDTCYVDSVPIGGALCEEAYDFRSGYFQCPAGDGALDPAPMDKG